MAEYFGNKQFMSYQAQEFEQYLFIRNACEEEEE